MASTSAAPSTSSEQPPSQDAFASIITQVSPTGQPARAPPRAVRPRQGQGQKKPSGSAATSKKAAATTAANTSTTAAAAAAVPSTSGTASTSTPAPTTVNPTATSSATLPPSSSSSASKDTQNGKPLPSPTKAQLSSDQAANNQSTSKLGDNINTTTASAPAASTSASATSKSQQQQQASTSTSAAQQQQKKKKRKSWLSSIFSSCMSGANHDDDDSDATMTERKAGTANAIRPGGAGSGSTSAAGATTGAKSGSGLAKKDVALVSLARGDDKNDSNSSKLGGHAAESTVGTSTTKDTPNQSAQEISAIGGPNSNDTGGGNVAGMAGVAGLVGGIVPAVIVPSSTSADGRSEIAPEILAANQPGGTPLTRDETADVLSGAVQAPGSEGLTPKKEKRRKSSSGERGSSTMLNDGDASRVSSLSSDDDDEDDKGGGHHGILAAGASAGLHNNDDAIEDSEEEEYMDEEERIIAQGGMGIPVDENGNPKPLLVELAPSHHGRKCLVLDLDETLVHSSFKLIHSPDFVVPVEIENQVHNVYVIKRPGVDAFMKRMGELYEVVVFTASLSKYADPVLDHLDIHQVVKHRLFRESCYNHRGNYVKDLSQLGRPIGETIIIDNSPASYIFHPNNAVPVSSWFNDPHDTELTDLQGFLADLAEVDDVRGVLDGGLFPLS